MKDRLPGRPACAPFAARALMKAASRTALSYWSLLGRRGTLGYANDLETAPVTDHTAAHRPRRSDRTTPVDIRTVRADTALSAPAHAPPEAFPPRQHSALEQLLAASRRLQHPLRNEAVVHLLVGAGLRPIEIALLRVRHYLNEDGAIRVMSRIERELAYNGRERPLLFVSKQVCRAIDDYLRSRSPATAGNRTPLAFRGLHPDAPLVLGNDGKPLRVVERPGGRQPQRICADIHVLCRAIFVEAQIDMTARDGAKLFARALYGMGADINGIRVLLGLSSRRSVIRLLGVQRTLASEALRVSGLVSQLPR